MPQLPNLIASILTKDHKSLPDFTTDLDSSKKVYSQMMENFTHADVIYGRHVEKFSAYLFNYLHPSLSATWVECLLSEPVLKYLDSG